MCGVAGGPAGVDGVAADQDEGVGKERSVDVDVTGHDFVGVDLAGVKQHYSSSLGLIELYL